MYPQRTVTATAATRFTCPECGHETGYVKPRASGDTPSIGCYTSGCGEGGDYLRALAAAYNAPNGATILADPWSWLDVRPAANREPEPLPPPVLLRAWARALASHVEATEYLHRERGLTDATVRAAGLGYDGRALVIPAYAAGRELGTVKRRYWPDPWRVERGGKQVFKRGLRGHPSVLYPDAPPGGWLLCEGELDALLARQHGLPAITSTAGTGWRPDWDALVVGRRVAVAYDSGSTEATASRVAALRAAGADAWPVNLGLSPGQDLTDWFVTYGRSSGALRALVRCERKAAA